MQRVIFVYNTLVCGQIQPTLLLLPAAALFGQRRWQISIWTTKRRQGVRLDLSVHLGLVGAVCAVGSHVKCHGKPACMMHNVSRIPYRVFAQPIDSVRLAYCLFRAW
jgi:hypothetical protein